MQSLAKTQPTFATIQLTSCLLKVRSIYIYQWFMICIYSCCLAKYIRFLFLGASAIDSSIVLENANLLLLTKEATKKYQSLKTHLFVSRSSEDKLARE